MDNKLRVSVLALLVLAAAAVVFFLISGPGTDLSDVGDGDSREAAGAPAADTQKGKGEELAKADENRELVGKGEPQAKSDSGTGAANLRGRLVRTDGSAVVGTVVRFQKLMGGEGVRRLLRAAPGSTPNRLEYVKGRTDAQGRFALAVKPSGDGMLSLDHDDLVIGNGGAMAGLLVDMPAGEKDLGDVVALRCATVVGQVVADGRGVSGVQVVVGREPAIRVMMNNATLKTDADGRFTLERVRPGKVVIGTQSSDYLPARQELELSEGQRVEDLLIRLARGGVLIGTVLDDIGQPIEGARITAERKRTLDAGVEYSSYTPGESTTTDASGQFRLGGLDKKTVNLRSNKKGYAVATLDNAPVSGSGVVIRMNRLGRISGILVDEKGRGIAGSTITVNPEGRSGMLFRTRTLAETDKDGKFVVDGVTPGPSRVVARGSDHLDASQVVDVRSGETAKDVRLKARRGATLTVTVVDLAGKPVAEAKVTVAEASGSGTGGRRIQIGGGRGGWRTQRREVRRENRNGRVVEEILGGDTEQGSAVTDENGVAVIKGLPAGSLEVKARHKELALVEPGRAEVPDGGEASSRLRMQRGGSVEVAVVDTNGRPLPQAKFVVIGPVFRGEENPPRESHAADADGVARVGPLQPGSYKAALLKGPAMRSFGASFTFRMSGDGDDLADSTVEFIVKAGESSRIKMHMPVLTTVKGMVSDAKGAAEGAAVELVADGGFRLPMGGEHKARTDAEGKFELVGLPSGKYTLYWGRKGAPVPAEKDIVLQKNQPELEENLVLPGGVLTVQVLDRDEGFGVDEAKVTLSKYTPPDPTRPAQRRPRRIMMIGITMDNNTGGGPSTFQMTGGPGSVQTDAKGRATIEGIPAGKYTLAIVHREYAKITKMVDVGDGQNKDLGVIRVGPGCKVRGRLKFAEAAGAGPLDMALVEIAKEDGSDPDTTVSRDGTFKFNGLEAGKYRLRARSLSATDWGPPQVVEVRTTRSKRVTLDVPKAK